MSRTTLFSVSRGRLLALVLVLFGAGLQGSTFCVEKLTPEQVALCLPDLLRLHLLQHDMDDAFVRRLLKQFVLQLDPNKVFFLKGEADAIANVSGEELKALAEQSQNGDFSHFSKLLKDFMDTQITRDAALYDGLEARKDEIKALTEEKQKAAAAKQEAKSMADDAADTEEKSKTGAANPQNPGEVEAPQGGVGKPESLEDEMEKIEWGERAATQADREKRVLHMTAALFRYNLSYLSENEAFKQALQSVYDWRKHWLDVKLEGKQEEEVPKLFLKSFMAALDPHSDYFDPDEEEDFTERLDRSFAGIGVQIRPCPAGALIEDVIKGGPADKSGQIASRDQIIAVDGERLAGLTINKIVKKIKGQRDTEVKLTILKFDTHKTENITLKRDTIDLADMRVKAKKFETAEGTIDVISVQSFYKDVHLDVRNKLREEGAGKPLAGVVLDLRFNHGGYLDEAIKLAGLFIEAGPVVGERDGWGEVDWKKKERHEAHAEYLGPLVVLVDQGSASASEIVAGTLKDYGRAVIVGATQTFGKGTVQRVIPLQEKNLPGEIKITTHQYFLAGGSSVQLNGVEPDVYIPGPKLVEEDGMLERASENPVPWNRIKSELDDATVPYFKLWREWKAQYAAKLQEKSKLRVDANPEFKNAFDPKKRKPVETAKDDKPRQPDEWPRLTDDKKDEKDPQAEEAVAVVKDMLSVWPQAAAEVAK